MTSTDALSSAQRAGDYSAGGSAKTDAAQSEYLELKFVIHKKLLDRINLEAMFALPPERLKPEVRPAVARLVAEGCMKARLNVIISGGTGAGKTTFLNMLSGFISASERIVTIEDAAELRLRQPHVARLETRPANIEGKGAVVQRHLLINALRMRPDRIIVGEVRGEEALDMLQAMNTGHDGSLTTIHANTPRDAISRLETMIGMASANLGVRSIRQQIASAVNLFIQISRLSDGTRKVTHMTECVGIEGDQVTTQDIFVFERLGLTPEGKVRGRFKATGVRPKFSERLRAVGIEFPVNLFQQSTDVN
jgi:pilus assembly protein CpaF